MTKNTNELLVACDGSCLKNPGGATGWAWVASDGRWASTGQPTGTNQVAELWGVISVLREFPDTPLVIQIDSEYALKSATVWIKAWKRNGWKTRDGKPVSNLPLMKAIDRLLGLRTATVRFEKVPGHDPQNRYALNTAADKRARDAAQFAKKNAEGRSFQGVDGAVAALPRSAWRPEAAAPVPSRRSAAKSPARASATTARKTSRTPARPARTYTGLSLDEGGSGAVIRPRRARGNVFCTSCDTPINASTGECGCSI